MAGRKPENVMMKTDSDKSETVAEAKSEATLAAPTGSACPRCRSESEPVDICDRCNKEFGDLCKTDANGYNCTCQHCGNNTYETQCPDCGRSVHAEDEYTPND